MNLKTILYLFIGRPKKRERKRRAKLGREYLKTCPINIPRESLLKHIYFFSKRKVVDEDSIVRVNARICQTLEFIEKTIEIKKETMLLDVGGVSDLFVGHFGKNGLIFNSDYRVMEKLNRQGIDAVQGDIEKLYLSDKSIDYSFCFETLEHTIAPIYALRELKRITKKYIYISVPYQKETIVRFPHQKHIVEFSEQDWEKIMGRSGLLIEEKMLYPPKHPKFLLMRLGEL